MSDINTHINYTFSDIDRYLNGEMTAKEMHEIERAALQDPFLADAIEGYHDADRQTADKHLNEIAASIQGEQQKASIIPLAKKKNYAWQIAASVIVVISTAGILLFTNKSANKSAAPLASNDIKKEERKDSFVAEDSKLAAPQQDSLLSLLPNTRSFSKRKNTGTHEEAISEKKKAPEPSVAASTSPSQEDKTTLIASAPAASGMISDTAIHVKEQPLPTIDTFGNLSEVVVTRYQKRAAKPAANTWTTDKGKPFILADVEVITLGKKSKKITDTTVVKPEGGWQSFHEYLFSKLGKKDTASFINNTRFDGNLELEFSFGKEGFPYDIKVLQAQDSTTANKAITAIQHGPKWISSDKKEKRLNVKY